VPLIDVVQGTPEWRAARLGKVTGSRIADVMARTKSGWAASRANYMTELILEELTGQPAERYQSQAMLDGIEREPEARAAYERHQGVLVHTTGFWTHPNIERAGASPDGLVEELGEPPGGVEFKCPIPATHLETLLTKKVPGAYLKQVYWNMACTERSWWDYVSYRPAFPEHLRLFVKRIHFDGCEVMNIEILVADFITELEGKLATVRGLMS